jgi:lipopolysaccharide biosynthesis glycosyltransferase
MEKLDVMYTSDNNYLNQLLVSISSLCDNNKDLEEITIHLIYDRFTFDDFARVIRLVGKFRNVQLKLYNYNLIKNLVKDNKIPDWRGTSIANARLFFEHIIKDVEHLLYLDSDTIVVNSLKSLENYDAAICMAEDEMPLEYIKSLDSDIKTYYNSGVIWINTNKWKEKRCEERIIDTLKERQKFTYPDQDLLNITFKDEIVTLDPSYNMYPPDIYYDNHSLRKYLNNIGVKRNQISKMDKAAHNPNILHSTTFGYWRPWHESNFIHPYEKLYRDYSRLIQHESMQIESDHKPGNKSVYKVINYIKLYTPKEIKDKMKRLLNK